MCALLSQLQLSVVSAILAVAVVLVVTAQAVAC